MRSLLTVLLFTSSVQAESWTERTLSSMVLEEKAAQLFMVPAWSKWPDSDLEKIVSKTASLGLGGVAMSKGDAASHIRWTRRFQEASTVPLLMAMAAEWGPAQRISNATRFPKNKTIGAVRDIFLVREYGLRVGAQLKRLGVHLNLGPVLDVNNNADNPVIGDRSFGEDPTRVAELALAFIEGHKDADVAVCAKHFPGHGDTTVDSHHDLPVIAHNRNRLDQVELLPFHRAADQRVDAIMTAHLQIPAIDARPNRPTSLSSAAVQGLLRQELGFEGLIVTDALVMKAVRKHFAPGDEALEAFLAGSDILLYAADSPEMAHEVMDSMVVPAIAKIAEAVRTARISEKRLDASVRRILSLKASAGLHRGKGLPSRTKTDIVDTRRDRKLKRRLFRGALTLARGKVPEDCNGVVLIAHGDAGMFEREMSRCVSRSVAVGKIWDQAPEAVGAGDRVIVALAGLSRWASKDFGVTEEMVRALKQIESRAGHLTIVIFGTPYTLADLDIGDTVLVAYQPDDDAQEAAADALLGKLEPTGRLSVTPPKTP